MVRWLFIRDWLRTHLTGSVAGTISPMLKEVSICMCHSPFLFYRSACTAVEEGEGDKNWPPTFFNFLSYNLIALCITLYIILCVTRWMGRRSVSYVPLATRKINSRRRRHHKGRQRSRQAVLRGHWTRWWTLTWSELFSVCRADVCEGRSLMLKCVRFF